MCRKCAVPASESHVCQKLQLLQVALIPVGEHMARRKSPGANGQWEPEIDLVDVDLKHRLERIFWAPSSHRTATSASVCKCPA